MVLVGSESCQKQIVKFLQNMVYSTIHPPPLRYALSVYTVHLVWEGGEGGWEVREKIEGQQYTSIVPSSMVATVTSWVINTNQ